MSLTLEHLNQAKNDGAIRTIDYHFASTLSEFESSELQEITPFLAALLSTELGKGNTCVKIDRINLTRPFGLNEDEAAEMFAHIPPKEDWRLILQNSQVCSEEGQTPLILNEGRLYMNKYWRCEKGIAQSLVSMASRPVQMNLSAVRAYLEDLFPRPYNFLLKALDKAQSDEERIDACIDVLDISDPSVVEWDDVGTVLIGATDEESLKPLDKMIPESCRLDWQKVAVASSLTKNLCFITGGPGTGKTTTVIKLLASIIYSSNVNNAESENPIAPTIKLVAPTGKAAMRLTESIGGALQVMNLAEDISSQIPTQASTLHRLLGATKGAAKFRFNSENKLHLDVLVVDEASMIDLPMMFSLVSALPAHAKIILLGDKDQLASVEAGSVLADFCSFSRVGYSNEHADKIEQLTSFKTGSSSKGKLLTDCISELKKSYRFHSKSGIGQLAGAINNGSATNIESVLSHGYSDIHYSELSSATYTEMISRLCDKYKTYLDLIKSRAGHKEIIAAYNSVRLLCAIREGEFGLTGLNTKVENKLTELGLVTIQKYNTWYVGRPVMVVRNDYSTGLYNGDIGITVRDPISRNLVVIFEFPDGSIKQYQTCRIPEHETAYAMTIHKSQGSEFADTFMTLPITPTPLVTRELVYTGVTRAKGNLYLFCSKEVLLKGSKSKTIRHGGLYPNLLKALAELKNSN